MYYPRFLRSKALEYIIAANAFMFIVTLASSNAVLEWLALTPKDVLAKPWTLLTNMFIHGGFSHILFNMITLFFFGTYLARITSEEDFLKTYFAGGLVASLAYVFTSFAFNIPPPHIPAIGASGAVFAVMGALIMLRPNMTVYVNFFIPMKMWMLGVIYLFFSIFAIGSGMGGVAHNAHLGGLLLGLYVGRKLRDEAPPETVYYTPYGGI
ncbi:MAG: rhomboid family intramembrane serine protease [Candidatus Altiarchaeales archaeon]|nr:rhomboid family intramembrane serine protease [Candidatus Altiarchaeales archaeon]